MCVSPYRPALDLAEDGVMELAETCLYEEEDDDDDPEDLVGMFEMLCVYPIMLVSVGAS